MTTKPADERCRAIPLPVQRAEEPGANRRGGGSRGVPLARTLLLALVMAATLSACSPSQVALAAWSGIRTVREVAVFQVEATPPKLNLVVDKPETNFLYVIYRDRGISQVRRIMLDVAPKGYGQRYCAGPVCFDLGTPEVAWRGDVRDRSDLDDALRDSQSRRECLTWTYLPRPSANWTTRDNQCRR